MALSKKKEKRQFFWRRDIDVCYTLRRLPSCILEVHIIALRRRGLWGFGCFRGDVILSDLIWLI